MSLASIGSPTSVESQPPAVELLVSPRSLPNPADLAPDFSNLPTLIDEVKKAQELVVANIAIPKTWNLLTINLNNIGRSLSPEPQSAFIHSLVQHLKLWQIGLDQPFEPADLEQLEVDLVRAGLLQKPKLCVRKQDENSADFDKATSAAQNLVAGLCKKFVRENGENSPLQKTTPTLHTWTNQKTVYTYNEQDLKEWKIQATVVALPICHTLGGLFAWTLYAHRVSGHNYLHAATCLAPGEVSKAIFQTLKKHSIRLSLALYWARHIDKTGADLLGVLHLGPSAAIALIGYLRALTEGAALTGIAREPHLPDLLRALLAAEVVRHLHFSNSCGWADALKQEVLKDYPCKNTVTCRIKLGTTKYAQDEIMKSVAIVASTILNTQLESLSNRSLFELGAWNEYDMIETKKLMAELFLPTPSPHQPCQPHHIISAATLIALEPEANFSFIFKRMIHLLQ